ncbi:hypothetical protein PABG_01841 [Paracoccidioides brasiliensis Pb03]|nr:hypothetical protein PABG_01841 [Paracoccidioides brasiliensis Pb03]
MALFLASYLKNYAIWARLQGLLSSPRQFYHIQRKYNQHSFGANYYPASATPSGSHLTEQLRPKLTGLEGKRELLEPGMSTPTTSRSPVKPRSLSDGSTRTPSSASPNPLNVQRTKDDSAVTARGPATPQRSDYPPHGLSLQMPARISGSPIAGGSRVPLSPKLDSSHIYGSPASVLPRRSRGLDFSRACTNLHHSTLAESSPDSSPVVVGRGVAIPLRRGTVNSTGMGSPNMSGGLWQPITHGDRPAISSSVSSVNMFESDTSTSSEDDDDESIHMADREDPILMTPQGARAGNAFSNPFSPSTAQNSSADWIGGLSAAKASLLSFQRARFRRSRHSSSSTSGNSAKPSPGPISPPVLKSIESSATCYFSREMSMSEVKSRRESLSLGTSDLRLSDVSDDDNRQGGISSPSSSLAGCSNIDGGRHGVIRRPVTRGGNLLPKPKNLDRIRAALLEEVAPIDFEAQREAEVIRQVRESDSDLPPLSPSLTTPVVSEQKELSIAASKDGLLASSAAAGQSSTSFDRQPTHTSRGIGLLDTYSGRFQTPPAAAQQLTATEDTLMRTPPSAFPSFPVDQQSNNMQTTSQPVLVPLRVEAEVSRPNNKRRRDEMLNLTMLKRRAVSPGVSLQNGPVASQSGSLQREQQPSKAGNSAPSAAAPGKAGRGNESGIMKRIGMQGMNETNDGLMNMSID